MQTVGRSRPSPPAAGKTKVVTWNMLRVWCYSFLAPCSFHLIGVKRRKARFAKFVSWEL